MLYPTRAEGLVNMIKRCLTRNELYGNRLGWSSLHKPYQIVAPLNFVKTFFYKENCFWQKFLWSDETKIELFWHNDEEKIWCQNGEVFLPKNTVWTLKNRGNSMIFWACFSSRVTVISGIMKSEDDIKVLDENLQLSAENLHLGLQFTSQ